MRKFFLFLLLSLSVSAQEINPGLTFTDGSRLTAAQLGLLVSQATIQPAFYTDKGSQTNIATTDILLVYSPASGSFHQVSAALGLYANTLLITAQSPGNPSTNDLLLWYSVSNNVLYKATFLNALQTNLNYAFGVSTNYATNSVPMTNDWIMGVSSGIYKGAGTNLTGGTREFRTVLSMFQEGMGQSTPTNLPVSSSPTNSDSSLAWTTTDNTNWTASRITREGLLTNLTSLTVTNALNTNSAVQPSTNLYFEAIAVGVNTNGQPTGTNIVGRFDLLSLKSWLTNFFTPTASATNFVSTNLPVTGIGSLLTVPHNLGTNPAFVRGVLVCVTNDAATGWTTNREIDIGLVSENGSGSAYIQAYGISADATNIYVQRSSAGGGGFSLFSSSGGTYVNPTSTNNFRIKLYAR